MARVINAFVINLVFTSILICSFSRAFAYMER